MTPKPKYSVKEEAFINGIVDGKNQCEAYKLAGYKFSTRNYLDVAANRLVRKDKIASEIARRRAKLAVKADIKSEEIIQELKGLALAQITDVVSWGCDGKTMVIPSNEIPERAKAAIKKIKSRTRTHYNAAGEHDYDDHELEIEMHSKEGPARQLGIYLDMWKENKGDTTIVNQFLTNIQNKYGFVETE